jgi:hypothetical protein
MKDYTEEDIDKMLEEEGIELPKVEGDKDLEDKYLIDEEDNG